MIILALGVEVSSPELRNEFQAEHCIHLPLMVKSRGQQGVKQSSELGPALDSQELHISSDYEIQGFEGITCRGFQLRGSLTRCSNSSSQRQSKFKQFSKLKGS